MNVSSLVHENVSRISEWRTSGRTWSEIAKILGDTHGQEVNEGSLKAAYSRVSKSSVPPAKVDVSEVSTEVSTEVSAELKNAENIISSLKKDIDELKSEISVLNAKMMELIKENEDLKSRKHNPPDAQPYLQKNTRTIPTDEFDEIAVEPNEPNEPKPEIKKLNSGLSFIEIITGVKK